MRVSEKFAGRTLPARIGFRIRFVNEVFPGETMANETPTMLTPPEVARRWGVAADKVLHLIHTGQIVGVNLAHEPDGRPRWRIHLAEVERFEQARSSKPPAPKVKRRRASATATREYF